MEQRDPDAGTFLEPLIDTLVAFWPVWLMLGALFLLVAIYRLYEYRRLARSGIYDIDRMDGRTFERYVGTMFTRLGYTVELTRFAGDYGGDLVLRKDGVRSVVQAKRYRSQ